MRTVRRLALCLLFLSSCAHAVRPADGLLVGRVSFAPPNGWRMARNYRFLGGHHVTLSAPDRGASLTVELLPVGRDVSKYPLDLLAEAVVGDVGRGIGLETIAAAESEVLLADRRAIALTGIRRNGPHHADYTALVARTGRHLLVVTMVAAPGTLGRYSDDLERIMDTLTLPQDPPPPDTIEE